MNVEFARALLDILLENALRILRAGFGVNQVESVFFEILDLLRTHLDLKTYFLEKVAVTLALPDSGGLEVGLIPRELIELAAHELQWEELRQLAYKRVHDVFRGDSELAVSDVSQAILEAFNADWPDREFYKRYS